MDASLRDFVSEAEDILESLEEAISHLMDISPDDHRKPDLINAVFRSAHSLKGLSGMLNLDRISTLSHRMESLLDGIRLDKIPLSPEVVDGLAEGVQLLTRLVRAVGTDGTDTRIDIQSFLDQLERLKKDDAQAVNEDLSVLLDVPPGLNEILSEYEEHRFRDNLKRKIPFFRLSCDLPLASFDTDLKLLTDGIKEVGELLTTLPKAEPAAAGMIGFLLYFTSRREMQEIAPKVGGGGRKLEAVAVGGGKREPGAAPAPAGPSAPAVAPRAEAVEAPEGRVGKEDDRDVIEDVRGVSHSVRVDIGKLDYLMNLVGELTILKSSLAALGRRFRENVTSEQAPVLSEMDKTVSQLDKRLVELRDGVMSVRMVPMSQLFTRLQRVAKKIARELGKPLNIEFGGGDTELDKMILEEMISPLVHMVRNALDHGIEAPEARRAAGKPEQGLVRVAAYQQGSHVVIEVQDDGGGIDLEKVKAKAVAQGILRPGEELTDDGLYQVLFRPGFSTKEAVTELSGRGVGMNVVKDSLDKVGGAVEVHSVRGKGTAVVLTLPITLAILQALLVRTAGRLFAIPIVSIQEANQVSRGEIRTIEGREVINLRNRTLPLVRLEKIFGLSGAPPAGNPYVVVMGVGTRSLGLVVEELVGKQDVVIKPLGEAFARTPGLAGAAELGDQTTVLVLDVAGLMLEAVRQGSSGRMA